MHGWYVYACVCGAFTNSTLIIITPLHNTLTIGPVVLRVGLQGGHEAVSTQFTDSTVLMICCTVLTVSIQVVCRVCCCF